MKKMLAVVAAGVAAGVMAGCGGNVAGHQAPVTQTPEAQVQAAPRPLDLDLQGRVLPCINEFCKRETYDLAWEHYYDYPVSYRTRQLQFDRNQLEYGYLRRSFDLWEPLAVAK